MDFGYVTESRSTSCPIETKKKNKKKWKDSFIYTRDFPILSD